MSDTSSRLATAERAARAAGRLLLAHYGRRDGLAIEQKGLNDFVSNADREAEEAIAAILTPAFPQDGFLGEETGASAVEGAEFVWCVDPLDGTTNFLKGAHNWCVSIGLWSKGEPVLGVIYDPLRDELFAGADGVATTVNGVPVSVSAIDSLDRTRLGMGHNHRVPPADFAADAERLFSAGGSFRRSVRVPSCWPMCRQVGWMGISSATCGLGMRLRVSRSSRRQVGVLRAIRPVVLRLPQAASCWRADRACSALFPTCSILPEGSLPIIRRPALFSP